MRLWKSAVALMTCGFDGGRINAGDPVQIIRIGGLPDRYRCEKHAAGKVNWAEIEASKQKAPPRAIVVPPSNLPHPERLPFDPRMAQTGERDE